MFNYNIFTFHKFSYYWELIHAWIRIFSKEVILSSKTNKLN